MLNITTYAQKDWNYTTLSPFTSGTRWLITAPSGIIPSGIHVSGSYNYGTVINATTGGNIDNGDNSGWLFGSGVNISLSGIYINYNIFTTPVYTGASFRDSSSRVNYYIKEPTVSTTQSILQQINNAILNLLETITCTTQQEDFARVSTWPLFNLYLYPEEITLEEKTFIDMNTNRNLSRWQIKCYNKLSEESTNSQFDIYNILFTMLEQLKQLFASDYTLNGLCEGIHYADSSIQDIANNSDIFMPKYLTVNFDIPYSEEFESV